MTSKTGKSARTVLHGVLASVLALLAFAMCSPQLAFADETTQAINGTMTITLQDGGASGAGATSTTTAVSSSTATGDALMWLILGVAVLIAGAVYIFIKSRSLATNTGAHASVDTSSKKKTIIVAVITALIACTCFGMFANKGVAFAKDTFNNIFGSSAVVVDNDGNVVSNAITVVNDEDEAIIVKSIEAPADLSDWNADITNKTIESGVVAEGAWDGKTIPATLLEQLKNNDGYAELTFTMNVEDAKPSLDYDKFKVTVTPVEYNGTQIKPEVKVTGDYKEGVDYEIIYGENINAGEGTVTIKGIGDYKGEKTYTFTIEQKDPAFDVPNSLTVEVGQTLADVALPTYENGTLAWNEPTASVGEIGEHEFKVTFTPFDTRNYKSAEATITVIVEEKVAFAVYSETDNSLVFYKDFEANIPAEETEDFHGVKVTKVFKGFDKTAYEYKETPWHGYRHEITSVKVADTGIAPESMAYWFPFFTALESVDFSKLDTSKMKDLSYTFYGLNVESIDLSSLDTSSVENMTFTFGECANLTSIDSLSKWDTSKVTDMSDMFYKCTALTSVDALADWDTSSVTDMSALFYGCENLSSIDGLAEWNIGKVDDMNCLFYGCKALTSAGALADWDTSSVTDMTALFYGCTALTSADALAKWNTSSVTDMTDLFYDCEKLSSIDGLAGWNVEKVESMYGLFAYGYGITSIDALANWKTNSVTDMGYMLLGCYNLPSVDVLAKWNVSNVNNMYGAFGYCYSLTSVDALKDWGTNTGKVTNMGALFYKCIWLTNVDLSKWNVSNVTDTDAMFEECTALETVNISGWNTSALTDTNCMFSGCKALTSISGIADIDTSNVTNMNSMFKNCEKLSADCSKWNVDKVTDYTDFNTGAGEGVVQPSAWDVKETIYVVYCADDSSLNFYVGTTKEKPVVGEKYRDKTVTSVSEGLDYTSWQNRANATSVYFHDTIKPTSTMGWFAGCDNLTYVDLEKLDTTDVTNMSYMFNNCYRLTQINGIERLKVSNVTNMNCMFYSCEKLRANISGWDVSKVQSHIQFSDFADYLEPPHNWPNQANASVASNNSLSAVATASVVANSNASVVAESVNENKTILSEENIAEEGVVIEDAVEATSEASFTAEDDTIVQEVVNFLSDLSKENNGEAESLNAAA